MNPGIMNGTKWAEEYLEQSEKETAWYVGSPHITQRQVNKVAVTLTLSANVLFQEVFVWN